MRKLEWLTLKSTALSRLEVGSLSLYDIVVQTSVCFELRPNRVFTLCGARLFRARVMGLIGLRC
jgi:hypothetical protein